MNINELSEYYKSELQKRIPTFEVSTQIDNSVIVIECIEDKGELRNYLIFDFWKTKGSLHNFDSGISVVDIEKLIMPLLVEFKYIGKIALKNKYHNTIKSDIEKENFNPNFLDSFSVSSEIGATKQISTMMNYINKVAIPFYRSLQARKNESDTKHKKFL